jgi:hypothetical protein
LTHPVKTSLDRFLERLLVSRATRSNTFFIFVAENVTTPPSHLVQVLPNVCNLCVVVASLSRRKIFLFLAPLGVQKLHPDVLADILRPRMLRPLR